MKLICNGTLLKMKLANIFLASTLTGTDLKNLVYLDLHNIKHKLFVSIT